MIHQNILNIGCGSSLLARTWLYRNLFNYIINFKYKQTTTESSFYILSMQTRNFPIAKDTQSGFSNTHNSNILPANASLGKINPETSPTSSLHVTPKKVR
jgi:hypothetical protein